MPRVISNLNKNKLSLDTWAKPINHCLHLPSFWQLQQLLQPQLDTWFFEKKRSLSLFEQKRLSYDNLFQRLCLSQKRFFPVSLLDASITCTPPAPQTTNDATDTFASSESSSTLPSSSWSGATPHEMHNHPAAFSFSMVSQVLCVWHHWKGKGEG